MTERQRVLAGVSAGVLAGVHVCEWRMRARGAQQSDTTAAGACSAAGACWPEPRQHRRAHTSTAARALPELRCRQRAQAPCIPQHALRAPCPRTCLHHVVHRHDQVPRQLALVEESLHAAGPASAVVDGHERAIVLQPQHAAAHYLAGPEARDGGRQHRLPLRQHQLLARARLVNLAGGTADAHRTARRKGQRRKLRRACTCCCCRGAGTRAGALRLLQCMRTA